MTYIAVRAFKGRRFKKTPSSLDLLFLSFFFSILTANLYFDVRSIFSMDCTEKIIRRKQQLEKEIAVPMPHHVAITIISRSPAWRYLHAPADIVCPALERISSSSNTVITARIRARVLPIHHYFLLLPRDSRTKAIKFRLPWVKKGERRMRGKKENSEGDRSHTTQFV